LADAGPDTAKEDAMAAHAHGRRQAADNSDHAAARRRGGQELPDEVQDRPEQNAGYDEAVRGAGAKPLEPRHEAEVVDVEKGPRDAQLEIEGSGGSFRSS
jgi:hypothetical protein